MAGCRNFLAGNDTSLLIQGMCFGEVTALFETFAGKCAPPDVAGQQLMRTVVEYIDSQPRARLNEPFNHLAIEAMTKAWPCKPMTFEVAAWALSSLVSAIGTKRTSQWRRRMSAFGGKAGISWRCRDVCF